MSLHSLSLSLFHGCVILGDRLHNKYNHDAPSVFLIEELFVISKAQTIKSCLQTIQTGPIFYPPTVTHTHTHTHTHILHAHSLFSPSTRYCLFMASASREEWMANRERYLEKGEDWFNQARFFRSCTRKVILIKTQLRACSIKAKWVVKKRRKKQSGVSD